MKRTKYQPKTVAIKAIGYVRVSTDKQELSPQAQRQLIDTWAALNDIKLLDVYEDVCSGNTPWVERPGLRDAVNALKRHNATWLVVAKIDRLSRDLYNQLHLQKELERYDARTIAATASPENNDAPEQQLMQNMLGSFAEFERQMIRARIKAALGVRSKQGIRLGAAPLEDSELGRCIVWAVWHLRDEGLGTLRITKELNRRGIVGPRRGKQHERNIAKLLQQTRPTKQPDAWCGLDDTFRKFDDDDYARRKRNAAIRDSNPAAAKRRGRPKGVRAAAVARTPEQQLTWKNK